MTNEENILLKIIKTGLYLIIILTPLLLWSSLIYPYITTKTLYFRLMISLILPFFIYLLYKYPQWRPQKSWLWYSVMIFGLTSLISSFLGINVLKSLFGDLERMWGVITLINLILFFTMLISVFRNEKEWLKLLKTIIWVATLVGLYGLAQKWGVSFITRAGISRIETTLGNAAFVAGYFLLTMGVTFYLTQKEWLERRKLNYFYLLSLVIQFLAFLYAAIRGAYLAFFIALIIYFVVAIFRQKNKKIKLAFVAIFVILAGIYAFLYINRLQPWVNENTYLSRLTSVTNLQSNTVKTRFISWSAGLKGFIGTPILGIGMENYNVYFDKYFTAELYSYSRTESWFDRAHNAVVEVMVTGGIIGLISYLAIFLLLFVYLFKLIKKNKEKYFNFSLFFALIFLVYFIQNIFVFDTLAVFILFLAFAAYVNFIHQHAKENSEDEAISKKGFFTGKAFWIILLLVSVVWSIFSLAINYRMGKIAYYNTKVQYEIVKRNNYFAAKNNIEITLSVDSWLDYFNNKSANIINDVYTQSLRASQVNKDFLDGFFMCIEKLESDVSNYRNETYSNMGLGRAYNNLAMYYESEPEQRDQYLDKAQSHLESALDLSPGRLQIYYLLAQNMMIRNDFEEANKYMDQAIALNPGFPDSYWFKALNYFNFGYTEQALEYVNLSLDRKYALNDINQALTIISYAANVEDYQTITRLYKLVIPLEPGNAQYYANLATTYAILGDVDNAVYYAKQAGQIDSSFKAQADLFIKQVQEGTFNLDNVNE